MYYKYWGKSSDDEFHLLVYHGLDASLVMRSWLGHNRGYVKQLSDDSIIPSDILKSILQLFAALHDAGKFSTTFQNLRPELLHRLRGLDSQKSYDSKNGRHDQLGWLLWEGNQRTPGLRQRLIDHLKSQRELTRSEELSVSNFFDVFARFSFGHHGLPPQSNTLIYGALFSSSDQHAAFRFMDDLIPIFLSPESLEAIFLWLEQEKPERKQALASLRLSSWRLAGAMVLSDWIASGDAFPFCETEKPLVAYIEDSQKLADDAFCKVGLYAATPSSLAGFGRLFPAYAETPTPLQDFCDTIELTDGAQLWVLEDVTGSGKTEASCTLASRMIKDEIATGVFVALPTMATSNAMYERMADVYRKFFSEDSLPSLVLSHGARRLSDTFRRSYCEVSDQMNKDGVEDSSASCSAWLADSTKKALLADVGVGTLDQVLLGSLRVRYQSLRALGMSTKALVVDEVHAYDAYMLRILETVIEHHARMGLPVILLSATLPHAILQGLCTAFFRGLGIKDSSPVIPCSQDFPLATKVDGEGIRRFKVEPRPESIRSVSVAFLHSPEDVYQRILQAQEDGHCICWIRNTIRDIAESHETLKELLPEDSLDVFHSRFTLADRLEIEKRVLDTFGKESHGTKRSGKVLLASQVVEQSLDLDFDVLISDLAPIDLMIQRAGRLHRHLRDAEGNRVEEPCDTMRPSPVLYVHSPPDPDVVSADWYKAHFSSAAHVYRDTAQLWRTKEILKQEQEIKLPDRARMLVESVYGDDPVHSPEVFFDAEDEASGQNAAARDAADFNTIQLNNGYSRKGLPWDSEERVRTRLGDEQRTVYLARFRNGMFLPYHSGDYGWDLSSVKVRAKSMRGEIAYPDEIMQAIQTERDKRWIDNNALFLVVEDEQLVWKCEDASNGKSIKIQYQATLGLQTHREG